MTAAKPHISSLNKRRWSGRLARHAYRNANGLFPPEGVLIDAVAPAATSGRILDIGVGTGRTTEALRALSRDYVGVDYSSEMIRAARQRYPDVDFQCTDARDLSEFPSGSIDLVWFSFNGIDYVSHEDRLQILKEIYRVTAPGGLFCFSSHNRDFRDIKGDKQRKFYLALNPVKLLYRAGMHVLSRWSSWQLGECEYSTPEFAVYNDAELNSRLLTYYITLRKSTEQLEGIGFLTLQALGKEGEPLDSDAPCRDSFMIHYMCKKPELAEGS